MNDASLSAFPGGFAVSVPAPEGGPAEDSSFVSGGFTAIQIRDAAGRVAARFDRDAEVRVAIAPDTSNPETGEPVKLGDRIPFWSYSEVTGQWASEGIVEVQSDGAGGLQGVGAVNHLSYFNVDWRGPRCKFDPRIVVSGNLEDRDLVVHLSRPGGGFSMKAHPDGKHPNDIRIGGAPASGPMKIVLKHDGEVLAETTVPNICVNKIPMTVKPPPGKAASLRVKVVAVCRQDHKGPRSPVASATVTVRRDGLEPKVKSTDADGVAEFTGLKAGRKYTVTVKALDRDKDQVRIDLDPGKNFIEFILKKRCDVTGATGATGATGR
jgi:hypothetical protein